MKRKKEETPLPERKGRSAIYERILALPADERMAFVEQWHADMDAHPDTAAKARIEAFLTAAHLHADVRTSPQLSRLVFLFRELLHDFVPGETMEQALEPLRTLMSRNGGGASSTVDHEHVRRFHSRYVEQHGKHGATSATATKFGTTTRNVRKILEG